MQNFEQYSRQIILPGIGTAGQRKLADARVLVVGAGGLGCPVLQYLNAAGVGNIGVMDFDIVSFSNLHRQVLYTPSGVGRSKALLAAQYLKEANPATNVTAYNQQLTNKNAFDLIGKYDIVVDGTDNFATRYLINDACVLLNKPLVYGSIFQFEGQVAVFNYKGSLHYRHLFAEPPLAGEVPDCAHAGVLGVLPGIIGSLMANEVLKLVLQVGDLLVNKVLTYNALRNSFFDFQLQYNSRAPLIALRNRHEFEQANYGSTCSSVYIREVGTTEFLALVKKGLPCFDVRELGELPVVNAFEHGKLPLSSIQQGRVPQQQGELLLFCKSGVRSKQAAALIAEARPTLQAIYHLNADIETIAQPTIKAR